MEIKSKKEEIIRAYKNLKYKKSGDNKMKIKKLNENAIVPTYESEFAAGMDLYSTCDIMIKPRAVEKVLTGISVELPNNTFGAIYARSGLATKKGLRPANSVGVVDEDYRGEIIVALYNDSDKTQLVSKGERIAQMVIQPYLREEIEVVNKLSDTKRGTGGFGSTGTV